RCVEGRADPGSAAGRDAHEARHGSGDGRGGPVARRRGPGRMSRETAILAIDLGTTEVKAGLVGLDGRLLGLARAGYATDADPSTGRAEQDPEAWWGAIGLAVRDLVRLDVGEVCAIGIDGHGPTLVPVD